MRNIKIQAVLFDFGGVLAEEGFRDGLLKLAEEQGLDKQAMPEEGAKAVYDSGFVLGKGTAGEFWNLMRVRTGLSGDDDFLTKTILDGFVMREWMIELVKKLHVDGYVTGILSDQTHWLDELDQKYHFFTAFDHVYNSYYLGKGKQDSSLFLDVAADLQLQPSAILFIDDNADNVARAEAKGWRVIHYVNREDFVVKLASMLGVK